MHKSAEGGLSRDARSLLADTCARFANAAEVDKVLGIQRDVAEVQGVMHDAVSTAGCVYEPGRLRLRLSLSPKPKPKPIRQSLSLYKPNPTQPNHIFR